MEKPSNKITIKFLLIFILPLLFLFITNVLAIESVEITFLHQILDLIIAHMANGKQNFGDYVNIQSDESSASPNYKPTECLLLKDENMTFLSDSSVK